MDSWNMAEFAKALGAAHYWWRASWNPPARNEAHERRTRGIID